MSNTDVKAVVMGWTEALNRHDAEAAAAYWSEDGVFTNMGTGQRVVGRDAIRDNHAGTLAMWSEARWEKSSFLVGENGAFADEWICTGLHTGDAPGLPATGKPFRILGGAVGEVRDGKIVRNTVYWNMADFLTQIGVLPPPAG
jgi:steroid delta-isomerase-like uncharacterized protein